MKFKNPMKAAGNAKEQIKLAQGVSMALLAGLRGEDADMDLGGGVRICVYKMAHNVEQGGTRGQVPVLRIDIHGLVQLAESELLGVCDE